MTEREILKQKWMQKWRWEIAAQQHQSYLIGKRRGTTSKEFKGYVKNFMCRKK